MKTTRELRTFVVEDSEVFRERLTQWIGQREEVRLVGTAGTAEEALRAIEADPPDLVLLDLVLPDADGFLVTRAVKRLPSPPRVVIMTFHASLAAREEAFASGADAFLAKDELAEGLELLLEEWAAVRNQATRGPRESRIAPGRRRREPRAAP